MRTDSKLNLGNINLKPASYSTHRLMEDRTLYQTSLSGYEKNKLFHNSGETPGFTDVSGISGLDYVGDGRAFAITDFDRDQFADIVLVNTNTPSLRIFRNEVGICNGTNCEPPKAIALRFVGGNIEATHSQWSNRDGVGVRVIVELENNKFIRESRAGEGLAAQNSATMLVGIGNHDNAKKITVRWPSGLEQQIENISAGTLLTIYENPKDSPVKQTAVRSRY